MNTSPTESHNKTPPFINMRGKNGVWKSVVLLLLITTMAVNCEGVHQQPLSRLTKMASEESIPVIVTPENPPQPPPPTEKSTEDVAPIQFAIPYNDAAYDIHTEGVWEETVDGWRIWRLRIVCPGAVSVNLGLANVFLPSGVILFMYNEVSIRTFTEADNKPHGELWTPIIVGDAVVLEINVPPTIAALETVQLTIHSINSGFRSIGSQTYDSIDKSGSCNIDVECSEGDDWRAEITAVGAYSQGGSIFCTGALINNALQDGIPYFLTAYHCGITNTNQARSLVVYWNFETSTCGKEQPDGDLSTFQLGASFRAGFSTTDFTLLELDQRPDEQWGIHYAGWDRSGSQATAAIAIHHPSGDEKRISFENDPTSTTSYGGNTPFASGTHIRVEDWDLGTTERGSSGSPLFDPNHRIIGQLHGGSAACGNNLPDWYGRLSMSWEGGGQANQRLKDWLDPASTGAVVVDTERIVPGDNDITPTPTVTPSEPSETPTKAPIAATTDEPTPEPYETPTKAPSLHSSSPEPSETPTKAPIAATTDEPTPEPYEAPTKAPSLHSSTPAPSRSPVGIIEKGCPIDVLWLICIIGELLRAIVDWIVGLL